MAGIISNIPDPDGTKKQKEREGDDLRPTSGEIILNFKKDSNQTKTNLTLVTTFSALIMCQAPYY